MMQAKSRRRWDSDHRDAWHGHGRRRSRVSKVLFSTSSTRVLFLITCVVFLSAVSHFQQEAIKAMDRSMLAELEFERTEESLQKQMAQLQFPRQPLPQPAPEGQQSPSKQMPKGRARVSIKPNKTPNSTFTHSEPYGQTSSKARTDRNRASVTKQSYAHKREALYNKDWSIDLQRYPELSYAPQRIPGYLRNSSRTLYGFVMRDLMTRLVPRNEPKSTIVVVSRDIPQVLTLIDQQRLSNISTKDEGELRRQVNFTVGGSTLIHCYQQEQACHALHDGSDEDMMKQSGHIGEWWGKTQLPDARIHFMMVDSFRCDDIMKNAETILSEAKVEYIVVSFGADPGLRSFGIGAIKTLLDHHYKVQLLSINHVRLENGASLRPNADITHEGLQSFETAIRRRATGSRTPLRGYVFATRGLDRAIPLASDYIDRVSIDQIFYHECPSSFVDLQFNPQNKSQVKAKCTSRNNTSETKLPKLEMSSSRESDVLWHSAASVEDSEAVCVRLKACNLPPDTKGNRKNYHEWYPSKLSAAKVGCATRILPRNNTVNTQLSAEEAAKKSPNVLVVTIHPISRDRFQRSLPKTHLLLQKLGFAEFENYTPLRENADLYSSMKLRSTGSKATNMGKNETTRWLWDELRDNGYTTLKTGDTCANGTASNVDHGEAFNNLMCDSSSIGQTFFRPNCVGGKAAAEHLLDYATKFITAYSQLDRRWAAFLHFGDSGEDSQILEGTLDDPIWRFLFEHFENLQDNTLIIVNSDGGISHGIYSRSPRGLQERVKPLLNVRLPSDFVSQGQIDALQFNQHLLTTPSDLARTLLDVLLPDAHQMKVKKGRSLLSRMQGTSDTNTCESAPGVSKQVCELLQTSSIAKMIPNPPSALSFYADSKSISNTIANTVDISLNKPSNSAHIVQPKLLLPNRDPSIVQRSRSSLTETKTAPPNILFIEVDSVSKAFADRHFPRTRELLAKYRIQKSHSGVDCQDRWCSFDLSESFSVVGPNSIPNQITFMSGCVLTTGSAEHCAVTTTVQNNTICSDQSHRCFRLALESKFRESQLWCPQDDSSPWIFDIARKAGYVTMFGEEFCAEGSPYVAQGNLFKLVVDYLPHKFFCRQIKAELLQRGAKDHGPLWREETNPNPFVALDTTKAIFDSYDDSIPKLVYLNALAAHKYERYPLMTAESESYDKILADDFLEDFLKREDAQNTIIVVRSDHGHQGPPNNVDYAHQIEALRPWTEVIVPKDWGEDILETLYHNQEQKPLVTSFDLYKTLTMLMLGGKDKRMQPWSQNLLKEKISPKRSCKDAKVDQTYCLYESERTFTAPNYGTCNMAENDQDFLCPSYAEDFRRRLSSTVASRFNGIAIEQQSCKSTDGGNPKSALLQRWDRINNRTSEFPDAKVSGGIFLYPRQTSLLSALVDLLAKEVRGNFGRKLKVCETGFGSGHSAAMFLDANRHVDLHTFDKFDRPYQMPILQMLRNEYHSTNQTITPYTGDSCERVKKVLVPVSNADNGAVQCDVLHASSFCRDSIDLVERSPCGVLLTATAMPDLTRSNVYFGPRGQWTILMNKGCIKDVTCFTEEEKRLDSDYVFQRRGTTFTHKWCIAITTGKCQKYGTQVGLQTSACEKGLANFTNHYLQLSELCEDQQTPVPHSPKRQFSRPDGYSPI